MHFKGIFPADWSSLVAVTGLAGHAYGSWKSRDSGRMWLRDFLPEDLGGDVRIMTYGYPTSLIGETRSTARIIDFVNDLTQQLTTARESVSEHMTVPNLPRKCSVTDSIFLKG